jgi:hypothetical protein
MVKFPVRVLVPIFVEAVKVAVPLPPPPALTVSHATVLDAVHAQPDCVVTPNDPEPPAAETY